MAEDSKNPNAASGCAETMPEATRLKREQVHHLIIIGSGPAGLTAALYAARANLNPIVFEGDGFEETLPGGQLMTTTDIENYPGAAIEQDGELRGIAGPELMDHIRRQAQHFGAECLPVRVTAVDFSCRPLRVETEESKHYAESVIIATGASAKWMNIPTEAEYRGFGVSACATCDGAFFKNKDVLIVGGGDTAMEEAIYLTRHCKSVTVVHRRDQLRASKIMVNRAMANPKIKWLWNAEIAEVLGKTEGMRKFVTGATIRNTKSGETSQVAADGIFVAIGHKPNTELYRGLVDMDTLGYIRTIGRSTFTTAPGVFACGDCQDHVYRQAITAAGTGCMAAIDAERFIAANPILYGIEEEVSRRYEHMVEKSVVDAEKQPAVAESEL